MYLLAHRFLEDPTKGWSFHRIPGRARALGYTESQMVKTLIFGTGTGEDALVMLGGDKSAISGRLKKALGSRDIKLADPAAVKEITGY